MGPWLIPVAVGSLLGWAVNAGAQKIAAPLGNLEQRPILSDRLVLVLVGAVALYLVGRRQGIV